MAPAGPISNNGSWGRGERRDPPHSHRGRARTYLQRGGYSRQYDQRYMSARTMKYYTST